MVRSFLSCSVLAAWEEERVLVIVEVIRGLALGGAETLLYQRLRAWVEMGMDPASLMVINTHPEHRYFEELIQALGVCVDTAPSSSLGAGMAFVAQKVKGLSAGDAIVFHSPSASYFEKLKRALRRGAQAKIVEVVHSTSYRRTYLAAGSLLDRYADAAIWVSDDVRRAVTGRSFREGRVILAGVDQASMRAWVVQNPRAPWLLPKEVGLDRDRTLVVAVANLRPEKALGRLVRAVAEPGMSDFSLVIVGEGGDRRELEELIRVLEVGHRVRLIGRQPDGWRWAAVADVVCQTSIQEGLPVSLMEAEALGVPVVATDVGGVAQILSRSERGVLLRDGSPASIAGELQKVAKTVGDIESEFPSRATSESYWDIHRYAQEVLGYLR